MQVREIMKRDLVTGRASDSISLSLQAMLWAGVRHLPIVDDGRLVGILSERDILAYRSQHPEFSDGVAVSDVMSAPAHFADPEDGVSVVAKRMADERLGCMPIVDHGVLVGMVTVVDMLDRAHN